MSEFIVTFHKTICDPNGHAHRCCQGRVQVRAASREAAEEQAKRVFALSHGIPSWDFHADEFDVVRILDRSAA